MIILHNHKTIYTPIPGGVFVSIGHWIDISGQVHPIDGRTAFGFDSGRVYPSSELTEKQDFWRCIYCGRDNDLPVLDCRSCGAPRNRSREP